MAVRPKDRSGLSTRQRPFVRSSVIVRSQTFSPGERNQYICRVRGRGSCQVLGAERPTPASQWPVTFTAEGELQIPATSSNSQKCFYKISHSYGPFQFGLGGCLFSPKFNVSLALMPFMWQISKIQDLATSIFVLQFVFRNVKCLEIYILYIPAVYQTLLLVLWNQKL